MRVKLILIIFSGILSISFAAIFVRFCGDTPPLIIATYRLTIASVIILVFFRSKGYKFRDIGKKDMILSVISGSVLALHFVTWFTSLKLTSVASSVVLVTTSPIFVGFFSYMFLKEKQGMAIIGGIILSFTGSIILALGDGGGFGQLDFGGNAILGDMFAIIGAVAAAGYFMIGSKVRNNLNIVPYITITYTASAIFLIVVTLFSPYSFFGYKATSYLSMFMLAIIPQLIGHTSLNWALKHLKSSMVAISTLGEPIGSTILAFIFFGETIDKFQFFGIILIFVAIIMASRKGEKS